MKFTSLVLVATVATVSLASLCAAQGCPEDALRCPNGKVLARDPKNHCEFPDCPTKPGHGQGNGQGQGQDHKEDTLSKSFTFSNVHL